MSRRTDRPQHVGALEARLDQDVQGLLKKQVSMQDHLHQLGAVEHLFGTLMQLLWVSAEARLASGKGKSARAARAEGPPEGARSTPRGGHTTEVLKRTPSCRSEPVGQLPSG